MYTTVFLSPVADQRVDFSKQAKYNKRWKMNDLIRVVCFNVNYLKVTRKGRKGVESGLGWRVDVLGLSEAHLSCQGASDYRKGNEDGMWRGVVGGVVWTVLDERYKWISKEGYNDIWHNVELCNWVRLEGHKNSSAIIIPVYKRKGSGNERENYRGISLISISGKVGGNNVTEWMQITGLFKSKEVFTQDGCRKMFMIGGKKSYAELDKVFDTFDCIAMWDAYKNYGVGRS